MCDDLLFEVMAFLGPHATAASGLLQTCRHLHKIGEEFFVRTGHRTFKKIVHQFDSFPNWIPSNDQRQMCKTWLYPLLRFIYVPAIFERHCDTILQRYQLTEEATFGIVATSVLRTGKTTAMGVFLACLEMHVSGLDILLWYPDHVGRKKVMDIYSSFRLATPRRCRRQKNKIWWSRPPRGTTANVFVVVDMTHFRRDDIYHMLPVMSRTDVKCIGSISRIRHPVLNMIRDLSDLDDSSAPGIVVCNI